jgi:hypothetical protein
MNHDTQLSRFIQKIIILIHKPNLIREIKFGLGSDDLRIGRPSLPKVQIGRGCLAQSLQSSDGSYLPHRHDFALIWQLLCQVADGWIGYYSEATKTMARGAKLCNTLNVGTEHGGRLSRYGWHLRTWKTQGKFESRTRMFLY